MNFTATRFNHSITRRSVLITGACFLAFTTSASRHASAEETVLTISTGGGEKVAFSMEQLATLPQSEIETETPWLEGKVRFAGPLLRDVLGKANAAGKDLKAVALNDYAVSIPFADVRDHDVIIATSLNGEAMSIRDKGPLWVMYPFNVEPSLKTEANYARCIWQLNRIQVEG
jgi:hypothetical protein